MTRFYNPAQEIEVEAGELGEPLSIRWDGKTHPVEILADRWRIDENWWTGTRVWRDYFKLATTSGMLVIIYHDLIGKGWYVQRLYD